MADRLSYSRYDSPLGALWVAAGPRGVTALSIGSGEACFTSGPSAMVKDASSFTGLFRLLDRYFEGRPVTFSVPVDPAGSAFDRAVWHSLSAVPWGSATSYAAVAAVIGRAGAARAVGGACGRNPIPVIIPCHRVLRADGALGGYSGPCGVKERLLALEGIVFKGPA